VAALELLAEGGPRQLTARNLGARVGMDGSSLFRHFENKGAILHAAIDDFEAALDSTIPAATPSWDSLRRFFVGRLALVQARPEVIRLAFNQHLLVVSGDTEPPTASARSSRGRSRSSAPASSTLAPRAPSRRRLPRRPRSGS